MGMFDKIKEKMHERKIESEKESVFQKEVKQKVEVARRKAYSSEAVKKAQEDARAEARRPNQSGFMKVVGGIKSVGDAMFPRAAAPVTSKNIKGKAIPKKEEKNIFNSKLYF